ncbi:hypothetical protein WJX73_006251 [Symbiochloris irregularis]|uniref:F-box domain-containing protein n=1 Tax=Symbiochloris irregularis TaxID=706552 RepID=A0AAW1PM36_9CHLO
MAKRGTRSSSRRPAPARPPTHDTGAGSSATFGSVCSLLAPSILPYLPLRALASLACTCSSIRSVVYEQSDLWSSAGLH